ncbi:MAG TPA: type II toxin-antitoxin system prevent-host-death family antitoxin [Candidatus Paceibacterota bacterium]|nr:type II toxin-antitoxin system prevent-host-death family antitoxin [Candidatus Paceibacterota bacterium]
MKTNIIGLKELRENMETYISQVEKGKSFTVVRRSRPVFRVTPVDEWGDDGVWETVVDFSTLKGGGMPAERFLKLLKNG